MATYTLSPFFSHRVATNRLAPDVLALLPERYILSKIGTSDSIQVRDRDGHTLLSLYGGGLFAADGGRFTLRGDRYVVDGFAYDVDSLPATEMDEILAILCVMCTLQNTIENPKAAAPTQAAEPTQSFVDRALAVFGLKRI